MTCAKALTRSLAIKGFKLLYWGEMNIAMSLKPIATTIVDIKL